MAEVSENIARALTQELRRSAEQHRATGLLLELLTRVDIWIALSPEPATPLPDPVMAELGVLLETWGSTKHLVGYTTSSQLQESLTDPSLLLAPQALALLATEVILPNGIPFAVSDRVSYVTVTAAQLRLVAGLDPRAVRAGGDAVLAADELEPHVQRHVETVLRACPEVSALHVGRVVGAPVPRRVAGIEVDSPPLPGFLAALGRALIGPDTLDLLYLDDRPLSRQLRELPAAYRRATT